MNLFDIRKYVDVRSEQSLSNKFREKRFGYFTSLIRNIPRPVKIVDIGGTVDYWRKRGWDSIEGIYVTVINLSIKEQEQGNISVEKGNALHLSRISDQFFDIAYSNSVIEHVYSYNNQKQMAAELQRVAKFHWIQTPNFWFPIEPHFHVPGWQWLPRPWRVVLLMNFRCGWRGPISDRETAQNLVDEVRLLTLNEMRAMFPDSVIWKEKFLGLTKSIVAHNLAE